MRPGPATRAASFVDFSLALSPLGTASRWYRSDSAPEGVPLLPAPPQNPIRENQLSQLCGGPAAQPTPRVGSRGGRNARATGSHSRAFPNFPWQFTLENCQLPPASPQIIVRQALRDPTFSMNPLSTRMLRAATAICCPLVQKLWSMCLPCGRLRKCADQTLSIIPASSNARLGSSEIIMCS
jgi:hypothetical protein